MNNFQEILDLIATKSEANELIKQLDRLIESLYEIKGSVNSKMDNILTQELKEAVLKVCLKNKVNLKSAVTFQKFLEDLKGEIQSLPTATLTFAFQPRGETVKKIAAWTGTNLRKKVLVQIAVEPRIIGGLLVEFEGKYSDHSLRGKLDSYFQKTEVVAGFNLRNLQRELKFASTLELL